MTPRAERRLLSLQRRVPPALTPAYRALRDELAACVTATGAHAWAFVSRDDPELHLEFLEFEATDDPRMHAEANRLLRRLEAEIGPCRVEEWLEDR